jgi:uncharacterized membrane protein
MQFLKIRGLPSTQTAAIAFVFIWFLVGGLGHFLTPEFFVKIVPPYIPYAGTAVFVSGIFELLGAIGLLLPQWRRLAGAGLFLLTLCVTPANIYMWQHPNLFPLLSQPALSVVLGLRLVIQVFLLFCIWWGPVRRTDNRAPA